MEKSVKVNLIITLICFGVILWHFTIHYEIMKQPYMVGLIFTLFGVGGYNFGVAIGKISKIK